MDLSIIIVNYKSSDLVLNCLTSVFAQPFAIKKEIIVVDNFSNDDSKYVILNQFPEVIWLQMDYNAGFARANNAGLSRASGNIVLLLNGDTIIENNAIERCFKNFSNSAYVACGVQLLFEDRKPQISGSYFMKGGINHLLPLPYLGSFLKKIATQLNIKKPNVEEATDIVEVDWINGAFLMVKKDAITLAGELDEDFFLYAEEVEWCSRLKKVGKLCVFGDIKIIHLQGETSNHTFESSGKGYMNLFDRKGLQIMLSNLVRIRKQFGIGWYLFNLLMHVIELPIIVIGHLICLLLRYNDGITFLKIKGFWGNVFYLIKKSPTIIKNAPFFYKVLMLVVFFV